MRFGIGGVAVLAVLTLAPAAQGAQRYAAPTGSGSACTQAAPCALQEAIVKAASNDEVILTGGTYSVTAAIYAASEASNLYVHGEFSAPMPKIEASVSTAPINFLTSGDRLSYLDIVNQHESAWGVSCSPGGSIERVRAVAVGRLARGPCRRQAARFATACSGRMGKPRSRSRPTPTPAARPPSRGT